jgi:formylmethanofuran dehydrogenase subunit E
MPVGFWDGFFDSDLRQRSDINDARADAAAVGYEVDKMQGSLARMQRQIGDLSTLVSVLIRMLEESGNTDMKVLRYRVEAELDAQRAAREQFGPTSLGDLRATPQAAAPVEPAPPTAPTTCAKCGIVVPQNRTTITANGVVCDRCAG